MFTHAKEEQFSDYKLKVPDKYMEYFYTYEIEKIKLALFLSILRNGLIQRNIESKVNPKGFISRDIGHRIANYSNDFKQLAYKLIKKQDICNYEDYMSTISSLILVNSYIEFALARLNKQTQKRLNPLKKQLEKRTKKWDNIAFLIQPHDLLITIMNKHFALITLIFFILLIGFYIFSAVVFDDIAVKIFYSFIATVVFIILIFSSRNLKVASYISKIYKANYKYSYRYYYDYPFKKTIITNLLKR